jgi:D-ribose pyranose/furanose isomerase RbsD
VRETGTLNRDISDMLSTLGHTDEIIVCDAGFAIWYPVGEPAGISKEGTRTWVP